VIDILLPVLSRPQNAQKVVDSIHHATELPHTIVFLCTPGDTAQIEASKATGAVVVMVEGDDYQYPTKINAGAAFPLRADQHPWLFLGADDLHFHLGWDHEAIAEHERTGKLVIGTNDCANPTVTSGAHATHSLVHRRYVTEQGTIDEPGLVLHPGYHHNFCDNEFVGTAQHRNEWSFAAASHVQHQHPIWGTAKDDRTYELGRRTYHADSRTWRKRRRLWR